MGAKLSLKDWMTEAGIDKWFTQLRARDAPVPRENVKTAFRFFDLHTPGLAADLALSFLLAMDLSRPVRSIPLMPKERVIAFRTGQESPFKLFFTRSGASVHLSGVNPHGRSAVHFRVRVPCPALESYTTGTIDTWSITAE